MGLYIELTSDLANLIILTHKHLIQISKKKIFIILIKNDKKLCESQSFPRQISTEIYTENTVKLILSDYSKILFFLTTVSGQILSSNFYITANSTTYAFTHNAMK